MKRYNSEIRRHMLDALSECSMGPGSEVTLKMREDSESAAWIDDLRSDAGACAARGAYCHTRFLLSDEELTATAEARGEKANVNEDPMLRSGLFFAGADRVRQGAAPEDGVDDGVLTAYEASQLNLEGTELVVLSACETGLGKQLNSDGVFGLRRGLQEAGADAVMMSMWSVPDKETQELMSLFYQKWLAGMEKPEALRQAQLEERETVKKRYGKDLPFYWGAFVLIGK